MNRHWVPQDLNPADWSQLEPLYQRLIDAVIRSPAELEQWLLDMGELDAAVDEAMTNASNDHARHTDDAALEAAHMHYVREIQPRLKPLGFEIQKKFVASPHRAGLTQEKLLLLGKRWQADVDLYRPENVPLQTKVAELTTEYGKITGRMTVDFRGQTYTMPQMARFQEETDRPARQEAWEATAARRLRDRQPVDMIFDQLLSFRGQIARNAGLSDYRAYTWQASKRFDYTPAQCLEFADAIAALCVPLVEQLDRQRRAALKVDALRPWDLSVDPKGRQPLRPFDPQNIDALIAPTARAFQKIDPVLGQQFRSLQPGRNLDLESRPNKRPGGYQASLEESRQPFIFMNAAGMQGDVDTLLHEAGHAFHYLAACHEPIIELRQAPLEFCEVASMGMELIGSDFLEEFYSPADAARARRQHLEGIIRFFPWMATIDSFQHWLYTQQPPELPPSAAQRRQYWLTLLNKLASREVDWTGHEETRGNLWHRQLHLFHYPFYYIEYGIAQLGALQLWVQYRRNPASALANYRAALALGGTRPLPELFAAAGIRFDFSRKTLAPLIDAVQEELGKLDAQGA